ncbi:MAG: glycoside hydrolase 43 family protein [Melioribacteraceae bacterium]|nr:glycoside hydrolase 43 family protein [Melioribacteraceae bacterium]
MIHNLFLFSFFLYFNITSSTQISFSFPKNYQDTLTYKNPIIHQDFSDPDVIRVGDDYFMTASSFSHFPGLPVLHSKDLVNWRIVSYAVDKYPFKEFEKPQHGCGIWAPSIRFHNGEYYIFFGDPDHGILMTKTKNPFSKWEKLHLVKEAKGWIDPCPFWDDDGNAYLIHAWARSRSGIKHKLTINKLSSDGKNFLDNGVDVFCDSINHPTTEGPKLYKRNGYYYIFAPAGGVKYGWQIVLRSKNIYGPYEVKKVLEQGSTKINGPHQGAWISTQNNEDWFIHFQDKYSYGRIVHLQPMKWENDWPVIGIDFDQNGIGEPVEKFNFPNLPLTNIKLKKSDDFNELKLEHQWQWQANFDESWFSLNKRKGCLRLFSKFNNDKNLYNEPALLLQKFPDEKFSAIVKVDLNGLKEFSRGGLIIFGKDYFTLSIKKENNNFKIYQTSCINADKNVEEEMLAEKYYNEKIIYLKVNVENEMDEKLIPLAKCIFSFSKDGKTFEQIGKSCFAKEGIWVGAKLGLFCVSENENKNSFLDFDWININ